MKLIENAVFYKTKKLINQQIYCVFYDTLSRCFIAFDYEEIYNIKATLRFCKLEFYYIDNQPIDTSTLVFCKNF